MDCLTSLDAYTAAAVLTRAPDAVRKDLLGMLEPYVAANIVQVRLFVTKLRSADATMREGACQRGIWFETAGLSCNKSGTM